MADSLTIWHFTENELCYSQQYTADRLNKLADSKDSVGSVGEYRQMNWMMNIQINFFSELLAAPNFLCMLWFVWLQCIPVCLRELLCKMFHFLIGCHYPLIQLGRISEMVNKPFNCRSLCHATGHPGPSLLLLSLWLLLYMLWFDLTARCAQPHRVTICRGERGWMLKNTL